MKKNFFIIVLFVLTLVLPAKSESYSSDPKTFISEVVDETKKVSELLNEFNIDN